ncbi:TetR/AcrR family transcriptional regulator [Oceanirhabdus seepicola]|uniref:TetR/AcrR family transcriptional regulator n=1 Tax=Oceanirhabdus seepicola TaxID=2828781 RepID=A0A9J6NYR9_9CLOT|nr:TetR/AcrR family transcriptional regulator [Oceanirhabdus seepicola]MCM1989586.1 TetR/AcrR family transcriptional regulator [Oceanirhabdus seepicola]
MDIKDKIIKEALELFNEKGIKFSMDSLARKLNMAKKTIYANFPSKDELSVAIIHSIFKNIKDQEKNIMNSDLPIIDKLKKVLTLLPDNINNFNYGRLYELRSMRPDLYSYVDDHFKADWENTTFLFNEAITDGVIREFDMTVMRNILIGIFQSIFDPYSPIENCGDYKRTLEDMVELLLRGVIIQVDEKKQKI